MEQQNYCSFPVFAMEKAALRLKTLLYYVLHEVKMKTKTEHSEVHS